jgi:D-alanyl-D-alanine carboxypeptidase
MMTLYVIFESLKAGKLRMNTQVYVSAHAARQIPSKLGLRPGEYVSVETIIKGLVTKSANDASAAIAEHLGGSESNFATIMTRKAKMLGMRNTIFKNASGVPNSQQITTARDMATLSRSLYLHYPREYRYFRLKSFYHRGQVHRNHNHLLGNRRGLDIDGIKTGYVAASGFNLAASAVRTGPDHKSRRLIAVVLGGPNRHWRDRRVAELLETNFYKMGYGQNVTLRKMQDDDNDKDSVEEDVDDDSEVNAFLKAETMPISAPKQSMHSARPIKINWPAANSIKNEIENSNSSWGVQLGTFRSLTEARSKAKQALRMLKNGEVSTPKMKQGKHSLYGARLLGITKAEAEMACSKYASQRGACRLLASD